MTILPLISAALLAASLVGCGGAVEAELPADGSYVDLTNGYALVLSEGTFVLTSFDVKMGGAIAKSGTESFGHDGVFTIVVTDTPCIWDDVGKPQVFSFTDDGTTLRIDLWSGETAFAPGVVPSGLLYGCDTGGVFTPGGPVTP